jgi:NADH-quinone oxidoreductase subunit L
MLVPLGILAAGALLAGYFNVPGDRIGHFLEPAVQPFVAHAHHAAEGGFWAAYGLMFLSGALAIIAIGVAYLLYAALPWLPPLLTELAPGAYRASFNKYWVDEGYDAAVVKPLRKGGRICFGIDEYVVDGIIWLITAIPRVLAFILRSLQGGALQGYALTMAAGLAIIVLVVLWT